MGCGQIGTGYDTPGSSKILSHANAYLQSKAISLKGLVDIDHTRIAEASRKWNVPGYTDFDNMMDVVNPDILSICVPTSLHALYLKKALNYNLKMIVLEKPITENIKESEEIIASYCDKRIPILVNYTRRFTPGFIEFRRKIVSGELGKILSVNIKYAKGILNNGSHAIDLCLFLFGSFVDAKILNSRIDFREEDPTVSLFLQFERCDEVFLQACDERFYSIFEMDICYEKGRTTFEQFGHVQKSRSTRPDPIYPGYTDLTEGDIVSTGMELSLKYLIDNVNDFLSKGSSLICTGNDALLSQKLCNQFLKSVEK